MRFTLPSINFVRRLLPASDYCRALFRYLNCAQRFDYGALGSNRKLGGAVEHLIDGSEKRICLSFEFLSPHVLERHTNPTEIFFFNLKTATLPDSSGTLSTSL